MSTRGESRRQIPVHAALHRRVVAAARREGVTISDWLRGQITEAARAPRKLGGAGDRSRYLSYRETDAQRRRVHTAAERAGVTPAEWLRQVVLDALADE